VIAAIWAQNQAGLIGAAGRMPWHLPEDLRRFAALTLGCPVVMGRKTFESLPGPGTGLAGRRNIVITRDPAWAAPGAQAVRSPEAGLAAGLAAAGAAGGSGTVWVIGGGQVYRSVIDQVDLVEVTVVDAPGAQGDTYAPGLDGFALVSADPADGWRVSSSGIGYRYQTWSRPGAPALP
jgi:dihydrofolate reductase